MRRIYKIKFEIVDRVQRRTRGGEISLCLFTFSFVKLAVLQARDPPKRQILGFLITWNPEYLYPTPAGTYAILSVPYPARRLLESPGIASRTRRDVD